MRILPSRGIPELAGTALLLFMMLFVCTPVAFAVEYGGFGGRPAYPRADNPRTESIFVHTLEPDQTQKEGVTILNNSSERKTLLVYAADAIVSTDGAFACRQMSEPKEDVGTWIALEKSEITLDAMTNAVIPFTITVPTNASVGEHNGCILIQEKKPAGEGRTGMSLSFRTGLRVAVTIPGELIRKLEIAGLEKRKQENGDILLHQAIKNLGNVSIDANVNVTTKTFFGWKVAEHGGKHPILRGETSEWNFILPRPFWGGWYRSVLEVSYDEHEGAGVGTESGEGLTRLAGPSVWFFSAPSWQALLIEGAFLILCFFLGRLWIRRQQLKRWIAASWVPYAPSADESVTAIAARSGLPWKIIARANKLKAPYVVPAGRNIRIPPIGPKRSGDPVQDESNR